jgi:hypothetical protein
LSNSHVLAPDHDSRIGEGITQPGVLDGGTKDTVIGTLSHDEAPLLHRENYVDAALGSPYDASKLATEILDIGNPTGETNVILNSGVKKSGRTSGVTFESAMAAEATVKVNYGDDILLFKNQMIIELGVLHFPNQETAAH